MAVLWVIALVTLLASAVSAISVSERRAVQRASEASQIREELDSAIRLRLLALTDGPVGSNTWLSGVEVPISVMGAEVRVSIRLESGLVDLNEAPQDLLTAVMASNGVDESIAQQVASRIIERRRRRFQLTQEMQHVDGAEPLPDAVVALFSVHSRRSIPEWGAAPNSVSTAILWARQRLTGTDHWATTYESSHTEQASKSVNELAPIGEVVRVRACGRFAVVQHCRRALMRLTGGESRPIQVLQWEND